MGKKCKKVECPKCLPAWLAAFGDLMSLLLCFFVLLLSMATMDAEKINEAAGSLQGAMSVLDGETSTEMKKKQTTVTSPVQEDEQTSQKMKTMKQTIKETNEMLKSASGNEVSLEESEDGFMIRIPANVMFKPATDEFANDDSILFIKRIALLIDKLPKDMYINVIGHTDNQSINTPKFQDNWALSTARATTVVKELIKSNVEAKRLAAAGKAEFEPIASNLTPQSRERNRRVELYFFSKSKDGKKDAKKSILDK